VIITLIYVLGTASILVALPAERVSGLQGIMQAVEQSAERVGFAQIAPVIAGVITIASLGGVNSWLAATSRLPFVAGIDNFLPRAFARLHPRYGTPYVALIVQGLLAAIFIVLGQAGTDVKGAYDALVSMGVIAFFIPYLFMFAAMIKLQARPAARGVITVPGGPKVAITLAALGFATTAFSIYLACQPPEGAESPGREVAKIVGGSLGLLAVGAIIYVVGTARRPSMPRWTPRSHARKRTKKRRRRN
jgi:amino acid transporter